MYFVTVTIFFGGKNVFICWFVVAVVFVRIIHKVNAVNSVCEYKTRTRATYL